MDQNSNQHIGRVAIIGFGEVGPIFARALTAAGHEVSVFDIKLQDAATRSTIVQRARDCEAHIANDLATSLRDAQLVFSVVTASQAEVVATASAEYLTSGQTYLESAPFLGLASPTDLFVCQAALPFLRARSSVEMLTPDCSAACW